MVGLPSVWCWRLWLGEEEALHEALMTLVAALGSMILLRGPLLVRNAAEEASEKAATAAHDGVFLRRMDVGVGGGLVMARASRDG